MEAPGIGVKEVRECSHHFPPGLPFSLLRDIFGSGVLGVTLPVSNCYSMTQKSETRTGRYHTFLKRLRAKGRSNMYGAIPYLMSAFGIDRERAFRIVCEWLDSQALPAARETHESVRPR
jgi:hypothetical protein